MEDINDSRLIANRLGFLIAKLDLTEGYSLEWDENVCRYIDTVTRYSNIHTAFDLVNGLEHYWNKQNRNINIKSVSYRID